ncbi:MAG TPA: flagellar export protein FliJ [Burkholderiales bacterium]|nr:flagellar export protein FliJ [Burkholderiales bacterium]
MPPKKTLQQLIELARSKSDVAARSLGVSRSHEEEELGKLRLLLEYRKEYMLRFDDAARKGLDRSAWSNYHAFLHKLDDAIEQQHQVVARQHVAVEEHRTLWHAASRRLKSFDALDQRRQQAERVTERKREQREHDEFAHTARKH